MEITNLPTLGYEPEALMVATLTSDLLAGTPLAGLLPPETEVAYIALDGTEVGIAFAPSLVAPGEVVVGDHPDAETAQVQYANTLDAFRREGWTVRDPEPWELPDPQAADAPLPF